MKTPLNPSGERRISDRRSSTELPPRMVEGRGFKPRRPFFWPLPGERRRISPPLQCFLERGFVLIAPEFAGEFFEAVDLIVSLFRIGQEVPPVSSAGRLGDHQWATQV